LGDDPVQCGGAVGYGASVRHQFALRVARAAQILDQHGIPVAGKILGRIESLAIFEPVVRHAHQDRRERAARMARQVQACRQMDAIRHGNAHVALDAIAETQSFQFEETVVRNQRCHAMTQRRHGERGNGQYQQRCDRRHNAAQKAGTRNIRHFSSCSHPDRLEYYCIENTGRSPRR
jgi:hypothetical protein